MFTRRSITSILALFVLAACASQGSAVSSASLSPVGDPVASVRDAAGRELGVLTVSERDGGLLVKGTLRGLPPGTHGIHLHGVGICEPPFTSAGGHWNPPSVAGKQHGFDNPNGPHAGDMRNILVASDSSVVVNVHTAAGTLRGANGLLDADGAAVVVHAAGDDYRTDPAGNSGPRVACGVVRAVGR